LGNFSNYQKTGTKLTIAQLAKSSHFDHPAGESRPLLKHLEELDYVLKNFFPISTTAKNFGVK
jgi:hypothetical protein